eukprot:CAMPEP_0119025204 /NCGR_PEP_ID=MMETSP1176-20130426/33331_1 /TAXON_ID=265551 /ORGANISM="Synedropsis recta cf, Strain CCMP1620" /LENGTH=271 /DNA_ID=CAMNT_0006980697 /DNA_START=128 /DNA_END=939 /DNA_ORIENTATION=+
MTDHIDMSLLLQTLPQSNNNHINKKCLHRSHSSGEETKRTEDTSVESSPDDNDLHYHQNDDEPCCTVPLGLLSFSSGDSSGSLSSLSSDEGGAARSIFSQHWQKSKRNAAIATKRRRPFPKTQIVAAAHPFCTSSDDESDYNSQPSSSGNTYERTLRKREGIKASDNSPGAARRILFAGCMNGDGAAFKSSKKVQRSTSCFAPNSLPMQMLLSRRNACSDSALILKKMSSCLRPPKYSGNDPSRHLDRAQPVSFALSASIMNYEIPQEQWA